MGGVFIRVISGLYFLQVIPTEEPHKFLMSASLMCVAINENDHKAVKSKFG